MVHTVFHGHKQKTKVSTGNGVLQKVIHRIIFTDHGDTLPPRLLDFKVSRRHVRGSQDNSGPRRRFGIKADILQFGKTNPRVSVIGGASPPVRYYTVHGEAISVT